MFSVSSTTPANKRVEAFHLYLQMRIRTYGRKASPRRLNQPPANRYHLSLESPTPMKPLLWLATIFINTFGITQPSPESERRMAIYIGILLAVVLIGVMAVAFVLRASFHA